MDYNKPDPPFGHRLIMLSPLFTQALDNGHTCDDAKKVLQVTVGSIIETEHSLEVNKEDFLSTLPILFTETSAKAEFIPYFLAIGLKGKYVSFGLGPYWYGIGDNIKAAVKDLNKKHPTTQSTISFKIDEKALEDRKIKKYLEDKIRENALRSAIRPVNDQNKILNKFLESIGFKQD